MQIDHCEALWHFTKTRNWNTKSALPDDCNASSITSDKSIPLLFENWP